MSAGRWRSLNTSHMLCALLVICVRMNSYVPQGTEGCLNHNALCELGSGHEGKVHSTLEWEDETRKTSQRNYDLNLILGDEPERNKGRRMTLFSKESLNFL